MLKWSTRIHQRCKFQVKKHMVGVAESQNGRDIYPPHLSFVGKSLSERGKNTAPTYPPTAKRATKLEPNWNPTGTNLEELVFRQTKLKPNRNQLWTNLCSEKSKPNRNYLWKRRTHVPIPTKTRQDNRQQQQQTLTASLESRSFALNSCRTSRFSGSTCNKTQQTGKKTFVAGGGEVRVRCVYNNPHGKP